jgi:hypothetical protein
MHAAVDPVERILFFLLFAFSLSASPTVRLTTWQSTQALLLFESQVPVECIDRRWLVNVEP